MVSQIFIEMHLIIKMRDFTIRVNFLREKKKGSLDKEITRAETLPN